MSCEPADSTMLPIVDLGALTDGTAGPSGRRALARLIGDAIAEYGFLGVIGHGIPGTVLDGAHSAVAALASTPGPIKADLASPTGHPFRGWSAQRDEGGAALVERFQVCTIGEAADAAGLGIDEAWHGYFHPNVWPDERHGLDGFEAAFRRCAAATGALGDTLMALFALALSLPESHFVVPAGHDVSCFAANYYPGDVAGGAVTFPEHTDSGTLSLLHQRGDHAGLEVVLASGARVLVPVEEDVFVVNIGELMTRWTNSRWRATRHRVVAPDRPGTTRTSLVTFHLPSVDTVVAPLPSLVAAGAEPAYDPVTIFDWQGAYLSERNQRRSVPAP